MTSPQNIGTIDFRDPGEPIVPRREDLEEYVAVGQRTRRARHDVEILMNHVAHERADAAHRELVNLVAARLRSSGHIPRCNAFVDLAATVGNDRFIFEMKSTTESNARSQVRAAVSQLYEYRYLQDVPDATLVLVLENPLSAELSWLVEYLLSDRKILVVWDGSGRLFASVDVQQKLAFLF